MRHRYVCFEDDGNNQTGMRSVSIKVALANTSVAGVRVLLCSAGSLFK